MFTYSPSFLYTIVGYGEGLYADGEISIGTLLDVYDWATSLSDDMGWISICYEMVDRRAKAFNRHLRILFIV